MMILANFIIDGINNAFEWLGGLLVSLFDWVGGLVTDFVLFLLGLAGQLVTWVMKGLAEFAVWLWESQLRDFINDFRIRSIDLLISLLEDASPQFTNTYATLDNFLVISDVVATGLFCFELLVGLIFMKMMMKMIPFVNL